MSLVFLLKLFSKISASLPVHFPLFSLGPLRIRVADAIDLEIYKHFASASVLNNEMDPRLNFGSFRLYYSRFVAKIRLFRLSWWWIYSEKDRGGVGLSCKAC